VEGEGREEKGEREDGRGGEGKERRKGKEGDKSPARSSQNLGSTDCIEDHASAL